MKYLSSELIESLRDVTGFSEASFIAVHESGEQVTSIRYNPVKGADMDALQDVVPWCSYGRYLSKRPSFTLDPLFHAGVYYVQEASSMFLWEALKQTIENKSGLHILDLCAAPGGKSTLLASYFTKGLIVSNEVIKSRASVLVENITKWGSDNVVVTNNDAKDFEKLPGFFDVMIIDAPCSGSGLFRKDTEAIEEWSMENVLLCSLRQKRILSNAYKTLKQDGILIYSTCSYSAEEDEEIMDWLTDEFNVENIQLQIQKEWNIVETSSQKHHASGYRFYPDKLRGEGFFIAVFKKKDGDIFSNKRSSIPTASKNKTAVAKEWISSTNELTFIKQKETFIALPEIFLNDVALLQKHLYLKKAGVAAGSLKGKDFVPEHALALSVIANKNLKKIELNKEQALQYLRKKDVNIESDAKGWLLASYEGHNLGWMKVLHNRINNYYPTEWRILKD